MAKVKAPLMSFEARGQLAKSIVHFPWKGINAVREYVIPANPKTDAQLAQRDHMRNALSEYHAASYTSLDMTAWSRYSGTLAKIMSGFNAMVKEYITRAIAGRTWGRLADVQTSAPDASHITILVEGSTAGLSVLAWIGTRKTAMLEPHGLADDGDGTYSGTIAGLTSKTLYYLTVKSYTAAVEDSRVGIYQQRTP